MKSTLQNFVNQFIQLEPGASWKKIKEHYQPPADADPGAERQARQPREANAPRR